MGLSYYFTPTGLCRCCQSSQPAHPECFFPICTWRIPHSPSLSSHVSFSAKHPAQPELNVLLWLSLNIDLSVRALLTCHCPYLCTLREHSAGNDSALFILRSLAPKYSIFVEVMSEEANKWFSEWMNAASHFRYVYFSLIYSDRKVLPKSHSSFLLLWTKTQILSWEHYHSFPNLPCPEICLWS